MQSKRFLLLICIPFLVLVHLTCTRHPLINAVDPLAESYIGYESLDGDGDGIGGWEDVDEITLLFPESATPVSSVTPTLITRMLNPDAVTKYWIEIATSSDFSEGTMVLSKNDFTTNECVVPKGYLENNVLYFWRAKAFDGEKWSDRWSDTRDFIVFIEFALPMGISPINMKNLQIDEPIILYWTESEDAIAYHVQCSENEDFSDGIVIDIDTLEQTAYEIDTALDSQKVYYWRIRIKNSDGIWGQWGPAYSFSVASGLLDPTDLISPADGATIVGTAPKLIWNDTGEALEYFVELFDSSDLVQPIFGVSSGLRESEIMVPWHLDSQAAYYWRVRSLSTTGVWSIWSPAWNFTIDSSIIALLSPADGTFVLPERLVLEWQIHAGAVRYYVLIDDNSDFSSVAVSSDSIEAPSFTIPDSLEDAKTYHWKVAPVDQTGAIGVFSITRSFTIDASAPAPPVVGGPYQTRNNTPIWTWVLPAESIAIRYQLDGVFPDNWTEAGSTNSNSYSPLNPLAEGGHTLYVQARDSAGNWSESGSGTVVIDLTAPEAPSVGGPGLTNEPRTTWTWTAEGASAIRYQLDRESSDGWAETGVDTDEYTPRVDLPEGPHTLYVQASDDARNWSVSGFHTATVDLSRPASPVVTVVGLANTGRPTWRWDVPEESVAVRYQRGGERPASWTNGTPRQTVHTPTTDLA